MNNAGTVLLTLADMSVIQAEVEVDETNIPNVAARPEGQDHDRRAARQDVQGPRHRDRQQPDSDGAPPAAHARRPTSRWSSSSTSRLPDVRPGFTCTADITTATRKSVTAVPIPAVAVRELVYDANGQIVKQPRDRRAPPAQRAGRAGGAAAELQARADAQGNRRRVRRPRRQGASSCRSRWASPATSTSKCSAA